MTPNETGATDMPTEVAGEATREAVKTDLQVPDQYDSAAPGASNATSSLIVGLPGQTFDLQANDTVLPDNVMPDADPNDDQNSEQSA